MSVPIMTWRARIGLFSSVRIKGTSQSSSDEFIFSEIVINLFSKIHLLLIMWRLINLFFVCSMIVVLFFLFNVIIFLKIDRLYSRIQFFRSISHAHYIPHYYTRITGSRTRHTLRYAISLLAVLVIYFSRFHFP